jgi:hypothetical protein
VKCSRINSFPNPYKNLKKIDQIRKNNFMKEVIVHQVFLQDLGILSWTS